MRARARAGLPSELQNHAAGAPLQFSQFFPVISRVCVRGRGKSRGSKRVCRGALVSGNASNSLREKCSATYPARHRTRGADWFANSFEEGTDSAARSKETRLRIRFCGSCFSLKVSQEGMLTAN